MTLDRGRRLDQTRGRLAAASFFTDMGLYLLMVSFPFRVLSLGASSIILGLIPALYAVPYASVALWAGHLSDRWPRQRLIRAGSLVAAAAAGALAFTEDLSHTLAIVPFVGLGLAFFWPSVQAAFSEQSSEARLASSVGLYNVSWSLGKAAGFLVGGAMLARVGDTALCVLASGCFLAAGIAVPYLEHRGHEPREDVDEAQLPPEANRLAFRGAAWVANAMTFATAATLNHHYPKVFTSLGFGPASFGLFLGMLYVTQTVTFIALTRWSRWRYRAGPLVAVQIGAAALAFVVPGLQSFWVLLMVALPLGFALGFCYQSSLYYSLHAPHGRGGKAGIHEAALGYASAIIPLLGGWLATRTHQLAAPFFLVSILLAVSACITWVRIAHPNEKSSRRGS